MTMKINEYTDINLNYRDRILYVFGDIDTESARQLIIGLDLLTGDKPVTIKLHTSGGDYYAGYAMYDAIRKFPGHVTIIATGQAMSMGPIILQAADTRIVTVNTTIMLHSPSDTAIDTEAISFEAWGKYSGYARRRLCEVLAARTGKPAKFWELKLRADYILTPEQALALNLVDEVQTV